MITLKVRLCPFNGEPTTMTKTSPIDIPPQLGSFVVDGRFKFRVAQVDWDVRSLMNTVIMGDYKDAKVPLEGVITELSALGWGIDNRK